MSELESFGLKAPQKKKNLNWIWLIVIFIAILISIGFIASLADNPTSPDLKGRATEIYEQLTSGESYQYVYKEITDQTEFTLDLQKDSNQSYYILISDDSAGEEIEIYIIDQQVYIIYDDTDIVLDDVDVDPLLFENKWIYGDLFAYLQDVLETVYSTEKIKEDDDKYIHTVDVVADGGLELKIGEETTHIYKEDNMIEFYYEPNKSTETAVYEQVEIKEIEEITIPEVEVD